MWKFYVDEIDENRAVILVQIEIKATVIQIRIL